jgi:hypothetical protein
MLSMSVNSHPNNKLHGEASEYDLPSPQSCQAIAQPLLSKKTMLALEGVGTLPVSEASALKNM